jgi:ribonuclease D
MCRPLSAAALTYARTDVHYSLHIAAVLTQQLQAAERLEQVFASNVSA